MKTATAPYTLQYNGKELQQHANTTLIDYGARQYNPTLARWTAQDSMAEKYYGLSPYAYCAGNPINMVDVNGEDWYKTIETNDDGEEELKYHFTEEHRSQADLDKAGIKGEYLGITYQGNNFYLSLLGDKFEIANTETLTKALMVKNIDKAIAAFYNEKNNPKSFYDTEVLHIYTDMNLYHNGHKQEVDKKITFHFEYAGGKVEYNVAKDLSFGIFSWGRGMVTKNRSQGYWGEITYSAIAKVYRGNNSSYEIVRWHFPTREQWQRANSRAYNLFKGRK